MPKLYCVAALGLIAASSFAYGQASLDPPKLDVASNEQITEILDQSERALLMNRHCLLAEASITVTDPAKALKTDKEGQEMVGRIIAKIRSDPECFHGGMDVLLLTALDDVSRNAALASASLMTDALHAVMVQGAGSHKALEQIKESSACNESSAFVYTVSENLNHLVVKELKDQNEISDQRDKLLAAAMQIIKGSDQGPK